MKRLASLPIIAAALILLSPALEAATNRTPQSSYRSGPVETLELPQINDVYVIHFVIDGTNLRTFDRVLDDGRLPNIQRLMVDRGARFTHGLSSFPTTSTTVYQSFASGLLPGHSGIPHLERFDREEEIGIVYLAPGGPRKMNADFFNLRALFNPESPGLSPPSTIFELLRGHSTASVYSSIYRGASHAHPKKAPLHALWSTYVSKSPEKVDVLAFREILKLFSGEEPPRYTLAGLYSSDILGHLHGPLSEEVAEALVQFDLFLGEFFKLLEERGISNKTYIIVSADHGMHSSGELFDLNGKLEDAGIEVLSNRSRGKHFTLYAASRGVASSHIYVKHEGGFEPIEDPEILRSHPTSEGDSVDLIELMLSLEATDLLIVRAGDKAARVYDGEGRAAFISCYEIRHEDYCSYRFDRTRGDPLDLSKSPAVRHLIDGRPHASSSWRDADGGGSYPDAVIQLSQIFADGRGGDAFITARERFGFRKIKAGNHGGPTEGDMRVPLLIFGPTVPHGGFRVARSVDIYPLLTEWFGLDVPPENHDGRNPFKAHPADPLLEKLSELEQLFDGKPSIIRMIDVPGFVRNEVYRAALPKDFARLLPAARKEARLRSRQLAKVRGLLIALERQAEGGEGPRVTEAEYLADHAAIVKRAVKSLERSLARMEDMVSVMENCGNAYSRSCLSM
ncbi:MAG TPA: alkaline phosphatase family protein [bacterium]|nr:alkaline phosphatase family protein [bacterium]